jgi:histidinol-phosphate aminotransferase
VQFNKTLQTIKTYEAGKPIELVVKEFGIKAKDIIKLASNENPYGCSQKVKDGVSKIISKMALYPDDSMYKLKDALAKKFDVLSENIIIGSGSDQVIEFLIHAKGNSNSKILINSVTFAMYEIYAKHIGAEIIRSSSQEHNLDEFYKLYKENLAYKKIQFLAKLKRDIGEQKIDVVFDYGQNRLIDKKAKSEGIEL